MNNKEHLKNIYYINVPETFNLDLESFVLNKEIKLPIETNGLDKWDPEQLSWEQIISAMLKIMAYDQDNKNLHYYREFIKAVRPNIVEELTDSAIFKSTEKDFMLAKEIFLALTGLEPQNRRNILNLAVLLEDEADWFKNQGDSAKSNKLLNDSAEIYKNLLSEDTVLTDVYFNAGYFFIKLRDYEKAETCFTSFIEYSDDDEKKLKAKQILKDYKNISGNEEIFNNVYSLILDEREPEAITILTDFLSNNENVWNAWFLLGWANRRILNFTEAITTLNKAIDINPNDTDTYNEIAICYMELGQYTQSQIALTKALKISPEDVKIISNMGIIEIKKGNNLEAKRYFETVLVYEPEDSIAKHYLNQLN